MKPIDFSDLVSAHPNRRKMTSYLLSIVKKVVSTTTEVVSTAATGIEKTVKHFEEEGFVGGVTRNAERNITKFRNCVNGSQPSTLEEPRTLTPRSKRRLHTM